MLNAKCIHGSLPRSRLTTKITKKTVLDLGEDTEIAVNGHTNAALPNACVTQTGKTSVGITVNHNAKVGPLLSPQSGCSDFASNYCLSPPAPKRVYRPDCWQEHLMWDDDDHISIDEVTATPVKDRLSPNSQGPSNANSPVQDIPSAIHHVSESPATAERGDASVHIAAQKAATDGSSCSHDSLGSARDNSAGFSPFEGMTETESESDTPECVPSIGLAGVTSESRTSVNNESPPQQKHASEPLNHTSARLQSIARLLQSFRTRDARICHGLLEQARRAQQPRNEALPGQSSGSGLTCADALSYCTRKGCHAARLWKRFCFTVLRSVTRYDRLFF